MKNITLTSKITLWVNRLIALIVAGLIPGLPFLLRWYYNFRHLTKWEHWAILIAFYCCTVLVAIALYNMDHLLRNIIENIVFTFENVRHISRVRWCCGGVSLICLPAALIYYPLCFMVIIMAFLCLVVSVVVQVMAAAVFIREENDLTI